LKSSFLKEKANGQIRLSYLTVNEEMKRLRSYMILLFLAMTLLSWSQQENRLIRQGNRQYEDGKYKEAEIDYLKSVQSDKSTHKGFFNLGDAWYMQENYVQASAAFDTLRTFKMDDETRSKSYYNLGNSLLKASIDSTQLAQQFLPASIEAYKQSLRLNPDDQDAKYNLSYAQKMLDKSQQQQQQQKQDKQDKQDQDKQEEKQDQKQDQQQDQQKEQQEQEDQAKQEQQQDQQQQGQAQQISKEDAERILEALKNDEKETLEKLKQAKIQSTRVIKSDKDW
jgi:septal ring factor EnvC (AmiA/AmiB activator)